MNRFREPTRGTGAQMSREIPFDHIVKFNLTGKPGTRVQQVINISTEGPFVATHMSFGLVLKAYATLWQDLESGVDSHIVTPEEEIKQIKMLSEAAENFLFFYTLVDSGTGRELQSDKLLQIATIGRGDGLRPFREFPQPMLFLPRSTVRIEVEEIIQANLYKEAELWFVLQGYKILA
ncbi:hypothetical protein [Brevibacillus dissolubilis]|uniref:hypothetical protein n=1 Tax=Brevibacillus dissolubilis TaxID=1844116 RepID=UPI0011166087|nr:hypothetical protein [Brevibacillus dissolubilis]